MAGSRHLLAALALGAVVASPAPGGAHPLGNFSISHYAGLHVGAEALEVRYLIDMAEIPTFQEIQDASLVAEVGHPTLGPYLIRMAETLKEGLSVEVDGRRLALQVRSRDVLFPPGAGGLPTMKIGVSYHARLERGAGPSTLRYADRNFPDRAGWKEIIAVGGDGVRLTNASVPSTSRSRELSDYPTDLLQSPPQDLEARVVFVRAAPVPPLTAHGPVSPAASSEPPPVRPVESTSPPSAPAELARAPSAPVEPTAPVSSAALVLQPNRQAARSRFADLVAAPDLGFRIVLGALAVAIVLGALHALEPGHGKTVVAAYLVGSRGTARHAILLGLVVTASHTAAVYLLGGVTLYASRWVLPERIYPWLGAVSGLAIAVLGLALLVRRSAGGHRHSHTHVHAGDPPAHTHDQSHAGGGDWHRHDHAHHDHHTTTGDHPHAHGAGVEGAEPGSRPVSLTQLFALGVSGGIVPCPAALVVLLSALALHRIGFGLLLIVAFSVGLAAVLIAIGLLMVCAGRMMARFHGDGPLIRRWLPMASAAVITVLGLAIAVQALRAGGIVTFIL